MKEGKAPSISTGLITILLMWKRLTLDEFMTHEQAKGIVDLSKLPADASETLRIIRIGDYDACACIGLHVSNTSEVGTFKIISHDYNEERQTLRLRFKLIEKK